MCASKPFEQMEGLSTALSNYSSLSKQLTLSNSENYKRLIDSLSKSSEISATVAEIVGRQTQLLRSLSIPFENYRKATEALSLQWDTLATISKVYETPEIRRLHADLMANNFSGLHLLLQSLNLVIL